MSQERLLKRGRLAELEDELKNIEARTRMSLQTIKTNLDHPANLPLFDLDVISAAVADLKILQARQKDVWPAIQGLKKDLGL